MFNPKLVCHLVRAHSCGLCGRVGNMLVSVTRMCAYNMHRKLAIIHPNVIRKLASHHQCGCAYRVLAETCLHAHVCALRSMLYSACVLACLCERMCVCVCVCLQQHACSPCSCLCPVTCELNAHTGVTSVIVSQCVGKLESMPSFTVA